MGDRDLLTGDEVAAMGLTDWRPIMGSLVTRFRTGDFTTGLTMVNRIAEVAEAMNHHPDLDLRYPHLDVELTSHDAGGKTERDVTLARRISEIAAELGVTAAPELAVRVDWGINTWDGPEIKPFWDAVFGLEKPHPEEVVDPAGVLPNIWFQETDRHETPRQRWHPDVWVPPELVSARVEAAVAAGGQVVDDSDPSFTVLADPQGNRVCLCTHVGRSH
jgi:4a-hydroxytetrahydrobiopterin dehydratase